MSESEEIEVKFIVTDSNKFREAIHKAGGVFESAHAEDNIRFDDAAASLTRRGMVLRLRVTTTDTRIRYLLTVKSPMIHTDKDLSHRREIETEISDGSALTTALGLLGYEPVWRYEKRRETYRIGQIEADIDEMPLGWFLELEGLPDEIRHTAERLGLEMTDGLTLSYAQIFDNVKGARGLIMRDLTFDAFEGITVDPEDFRAKGSPG